MRRADPARGMIAILRSAPEGPAMAAALCRAGIAALAAPVMRIRFSGRAGALNPRRFPAFTLFTSPRGVAATLRRLSPTARRRLRSQRPAAGGVGPATAAAARAAGYRVVAGLRANGAAELQRELSRSRFFHTLERGAEILVISPERDNPLPEFIRRRSVKHLSGWRVVRRADYSALPHAGGIRRLLALLKARRLAGLIAGSPRQMEFLWRKSGPRQRAQLIPLPCLVPGATTARAVRGLGFTRVIVVPALRSPACGKILARLTSRASTVRRPIK
jgi:uroporphyrinogen-III synthase